MNLDEALTLVNSAYWAARVQPAPDGCLWWTGSLNADGYPGASLNGRGVLAHRAALTVALGRPILPGYEAGHVCHDRAYAAGLCIATSDAPCAHRRCVNPAHLAEQDRRTNILAGGSPAGVNARKDVCPVGHPLTGDNLQIAKERTGSRACRTCDQDTGIAQRAAIRAAAAAIGVTQAQYEARHGRSQAVAARITTEARTRWLPLFPLPTQPEQTPKLTFAPEHDRSTHP